MKLDDFLEEVLPPTGDYYIEWTTWPGKKHKPQKASDLAAASLLIRQKSQSAYDTWVAIGSFDGARRGDNCLLKKALYVDVDCGKGKDYQDIREAAAALVLAIKGNHVPHPTIVLESGNGLHVYWVLKEAVQVADWRTLSFRLKTACDKAGLRVDDKVTTDAARILRPPETFNYKDRSNPKRVRVAPSNYWPEHKYDFNTLSLMLPAAADYTDMGTPPKETGNAAVLASLVNVDDLTNGVDLGPFNSKPEQEQIRLAKQMLDHLTDPKYMRYDNWLRVGAALFDGARSSTSADTSEWMDLWDGWSQQSPKYDPAEIEAKWEKEFPGFSNVHIGSLIYMAKQHGFCFPNAIRAVKYPPGYIATEFGTIRKPDDNEDHAVFVMSAHLHNVDVRVDQDRGYVFSATAIDPKSKKALALETSTVSFNGNGKMGEEYGKAGISIKDARQSREIIMFMESFIEEITRLRGVSDAVNRFGWCDKEDKGGFAVGKTVYWEGSSTTEGVSAPPELKTLYSPNGSLPVWQSIVQPILDQNRQPINCAIAASFAAPLMSFTGVSGAILSLYSRDSATGKSTGIRAGQSVWSRPQGTVFSLDDTVNSVTKTVETLNNLPAYWDELRMAHMAQEFIKVVFQLSQGKGKSRLTSAAKLQNTGTWNTLMVVGGNERLASHINNFVTSTNAGTLRLMELEVGQINATNSLTSQMDTFNALDKNYGVAGAIYAKWLAANRDVAKSMTLKIMNAFDAALNPKPEERFWLATIAILWTGAFIATKKIGVLNFDLTALHEYLTQTFKEHQTAAAPKAARNAAIILLREYLLQTKSHSITTDKIAIRGRGRPPRVDILWPTATSNIRHPLAYQRGEDDTLLVEFTGFKDWLFSRKGSTEDGIVDSLVAMGAVRKDRVTIGAGSAETTPSTPGLFFDLTIPAFSQIF